jgi:hypothetical protein
MVGSHSRVLVGMLLWRRYLLVVTGGAAAVAARGKDI